MWDDFLLYVNPEGRELLLKTLLTDKTRLEQISTLQIKIDQNKIEYINPNASTTFDTESFINIPLSLLNRIGLIDSERFVELTKRSGVFPNKYKGNLHLHFYLYSYEKQQKVFLLQHEIPSPPVNLKPQEPQMKIGKEFFSVPPEEIIEIYGASFQIKENHLVVKKGMVYVPWKYKFKHIPLYPLLSIGLTSVETIQELGGENDFDEEESLD